MFRNCLKWFKVFTVYILFTGWKLNGLYNIYKQFMMAPYNNAKQACPTSMNYWSLSVFADWWVLKAKKSNWKTGALHPLKNKLGLKAKGKKKAKTKMSKSRQTDEAIEISNEESSDSQIAKCAVDEDETEEAKGQKHGPESKTRQHWHEPIVVVKPGRALKWKFRCKYCSVCVLTFTVTWLCPDSIYCL